MSRAPARPASSKTACRRSQRSIAAPVSAASANRARGSSHREIVAPSSRAVLVRAILPNEGARQKPGMLLSVKVRLEERISDAVPELAVTGEGGSRFVYVIGPGAKAKQVEIKTGLRDAGLIEVKGVPPRSKVIVEGVVKVVDGMKVRLSGGKPRDKEAT